MNQEISILIPCYNGEKYIKRCIESCINQTYKNIRIIIVNDGSTDNSFEIINGYKKIYNNIYIYSQRNKGLSKTRNILLEKCKTKLGYFLDADDWLENDCIENFMKEFDDEHQMIVNSCYIFNGKRKKEFYITKKINKETNKFSFIKNNTFFAWNIVFDVEWVKKENLWFYDETSFFEDAGIMTIWFLSATKIKFIRKPGYNYDISNLNSLSHSKKMRYEKIMSSINQLKNLYENLKKFYNKNKIDKEILDQLAFYHCIIFTYIQFQSNVEVEEKKKLKKSLKELEENNWKLKYPKRYWKFWYFVLYRLFFY